MPTKVALLLPLIGLPEALQSLGLFLDLSVFSSERFSLLSYDLPGILQGLGLLLEPIGIWHRPA
jgi:hypothetical protein